MASRPLLLDRERCVPDAGAPCLAGGALRNLGRVFSAQDREALQDELIAIARADPGVNAAALVGSSATGETDQWSDIDLAMSVSGERDQAKTIARWSDRMYGEHGAVHHLDIVSETRSTASSCSRARSRSVSRSGRLTIPSFG